MSVAAKILIVINLVLAVAFLAASATYLGQKTNFKVELEKEQVAHKKTKDVLTGQYEEEKADKEKAQRALGIANTEAKERQKLITEKARAYDQMDKAFTALSTAHDNLTVKLEVLQGEIKTKDEQITGLRSEASTAVKEREQAVKRANSAVAEAQRRGDEVLESQQRIRRQAKNLTAMEKELNVTKLELKAYKERMDLGDITASRAIDGVVTGVSKNVNLVMLSVGRDDGVELGYEFTVYRGGQYVAKIVVDRVEKDHCTGHAKEGVQAAPIQEGDRATTRF